MPTTTDGRLIASTALSGDEPIPLSLDERRNIAGRLRDWNDLVRFCRATGAISARDERIPRDTRDTPTMGDVSTGREATPA